LLAGLTLFLSLLCLKSINNNQFHDKIICSILQA
jgi:hypothetical protein